jgi:hypothetical protein
LACLYSCFQEIQIEKKSYRLDFANLVGFSFLSDKVGTGNRRLIKSVLILILVAVFPVLILTAFYSSLNVAATNSPLFKFGNFGQSSNNVLLTTTNNTIFSFTENNTSLFNQPNNSFPSLPAIPANFIIILIILAFLVVGFGLVRNLQRQNSLSGFDLSEDAKTKRAEIVAALDTALSQLGRGGEYRETILECYRKISQIIETKAAFDGSSFTPREFKKIASERLQLQSYYLSEVTDLFELARYSQHGITEDEAQSAIACFTNLKAELTQV